MSTRATIRVGGKTHTCDSQGEHAIVATASCPHCSASPLKVAGSGMRIGEDDKSYVADGFCLSCRGRVGAITAKVNTLFGLKEDEAVLKHGRARVY